MCEKRKGTGLFILLSPGSVVGNWFSTTRFLKRTARRHVPFLSFEVIQKYIPEHLLTMLEWTVACSMYLAMPVTNAFLSSKLVLKFGCRETQYRTKYLVEKSRFIYTANMNTLWGFGFVLRSIYSFS